MTYWSRGTPLPSYKNKHANTALAILLARERESEVAKLDYITYTLLTLSKPTNKEMFESSNSSISNIRKVVVETLNGSIYNSNILAKRKKNLEDIKKQDENLIKKLDLLSKS